MQYALAHIKALTTPVQDYIGKLKKIAEDHKYVVFYGCGIILNSIIECWNNYTGFKIDFLCDRNPAKWHTKIHGIQCISPDELTSIKDETAVFITTGALLEVYDFLKKRDFPFVFPIYKYDMKSSPIICGSGIDEMQKKLAETFMLLEDKRSIEVFETSLQRAFKGSDQIDIMSRVMDKDQCFADVLSLGKHESFVDGGAFDGDTILDFIDRVDGQFDHIYAFELTTENYQNLTARVQKLPAAGKIHCYNLGLYDSREEISYSATERDSAIGLGSSRAFVDRLDAVLGNAPVTFIKLDIEGAEMHALRGAVNIIQTQKPKMAVCVYHDLMHLYEVPLYLKAIVPEYKIFFRHHTMYEHDTICYAVPT
ncbi:MAG: FkbM family methyltransferase [Lentisphaerae bacterium]|nr:FkbM family methyltransferase [Lentisphaerota bacterium]